MNILIQVDSDGNNLKIFDGIVDYKQVDSDVSKANALITTNRGVRNLRKMKIGWKFLIQWKDVTTTYMPLKILKDFNPFDVAEFLVTRGISDEATFSWWAPFTLNNRDRVISAV